MEVYKILNYILNLFILLFSVRSSTLKNLASAKVSIPPQLTPIVNEKEEIIKYVWKVSLLKSQEHWTGS